ncbi:unnamed protein product [Cyclocybe aegerita]|uniref:Uncharacterized protein n=1 Tax=Cyclocybe aegerita TaxID=1973307 RepID=A0A8S0WBZ0_CYCAE|nr:unnamed protein product [Cyclocybe aegerita]
MSAKDYFGTVYYMHNIPVHSSQILDISIPWSNLVSFDLGCIALASDVTLVVMHRAATNLHEAAFRVDFGASAHRSLMDPPPVRMKALRELRVILEGNGLTDAGFFGRVSVPCLRDLRVDMTSPNTDGWNLHFFRPLFASCSKKLEVLELINAPGPTTTHSSLANRQRRQVTHLELEALLESTPNLHTLRLPRGIFTHNATLRKLEIADLLPSLRALEVTPSSFANAEDILCMLATRMEVVEAARRGIGTSNTNGEEEEEEERHVEPITDVVLHSPLAERSAFLKDVVPRYLPRLRGVRIRVEAW